MDAPADLGFFEGIARDLASGKGQIRFLLQPLAAIFLGARLGVADAKEGHAPFLLRIFRAKGKRGQMFERSLSDVVIPLCLAMIIDGILQYYTLGVVRPLQAAIVGMVLVWLPYALARALANRATRARHTATRTVA